MPQLDLDLTDIIRTKLGADYSPAKLHAIDDIVQELRKEKDVLDEAVDRGGVSGREFAERANAMVQRYAIQFSAILGSTDYERVFGMKTPKAVGVIDPSRTAATYR